jgi:hypothetical protein
MAQGACDGDAVAPVDDAVAVVPPLMIWVRQAAEAAGRSYVAAGRSSFGA